MRSKQKVRRLILFCFFSLFLIGVGYALIASDVTINGNLVIDKTTWDIHIENVKLNDKSNVGSLPTLAENDTVLNFAINIEKPGDFYGFSFDVVNNGTIDAMLSSISIDGLPASLQDKIHYTMTYADKTVPQTNDLLEAGSHEKIVISYEYPYDIGVEDLIGISSTTSLTLTFSYVQATGNTNLRNHSFSRTLSYNAIPDNTSSSFVVASTGIDFKNTSSDTNGKGLYLLSSTSSNTNPIYYYRGDINNNNALFAGFCWKIVRTTETGGTKLIYDGLPNEENGCTNTTGSTTRISPDSSFNLESNSPAYNGYMYGTVYEYQSQEKEQDYVFGNSFTYANGTYTLSDTSNSLDNTHHYTCFSQDLTCSSISYVYYDQGSTLYYISLSDGKSVEDAWREMQTNTNDSSMKTTLDNWFHTTFKTYFTEKNKDYRNYLEDTVWCNDRSWNTIDLPVSVGASSVSNGFIPNGGTTNSYLWYGYYGRIKTGTPTLTCPNKNDAFTVSDTTNGNGALTYPIGLLTADEIVLAGGQLNDVTGRNHNFYLKTSQWYTLTPGSFSEYNASQIVASSYVGNLKLIYSSGVRPSISLKSSVKVKYGTDGTTANPYVFLD